MEIGIDDRIGAVIVDQSADDPDGGELTTDWSAFYNKTNVSLSNFEKSTSPAFELWFGMPVTSESKKDYKYEGDVYDTLKQSLWGMDTGVNLGWTFEIDTKGLWGERPIYLTPLVGYNWRFFRFVRSDSESGIYDNDFDYGLHYIDVGGLINVGVCDKLDVYFKPMFGIGVYSTYYQNGMGTVTDSGDSWYADLDLGLNYKLTEHFTLNISAFYDFLTMDGGVKSGNNFFDTDMHTVGGKIGLTYNF